jgi:ferritin-like protein
MYLSIDEWIKKLSNMYAMEYYSTIKRMKFCHLQENVNHHVSEVSQPEKDKYHIFYLVCAM